MGLLSGGQILAKKKYIFGAKEANDPNAVTTFDDSPGALKKKLRYLHKILFSFLRENCFHVIFLELQLWKLLKTYQWTCKTKLSKKVSMFSSLITLSFIQLRELTKYSTKNFISGLEY